VCCVCAPTGRDLEARAADVAAELSRAKAAAELHLSHESAAAAQLDEVATGLRQQLREVQRQVADEAAAGHAQQQRRAEAEAKARDWQQQAQASAQKVTAVCRARARAVCLIYK
jgi:hypothetical protein